LRAARAVGDENELILSPLDKLDDPASLIELRKKVASMLPRVDLPELILEIAARTGFTDAFTHISERTARATDLRISLCAVLMAGACNTGIEPLIRGGGEVASADGMRFVVPVRTVHAGPNPKYFGIGRGVTCTT
jgi:hypothetical protein